MADINTQTNPTVIKISDFFLQHVMEYTSIKIDIIHNSPGRMLAPVKHNT